MSPPPEKSAGFFSRWSQRKTQAQQADSPLAEEKPEQPARTPPAPESSAAHIAAPLSPEPSPAAPEQSLPPPDLPSLQDAQQLQADSDFKPFMARGVTPEVRNTALKKLFTDPHYNVMDGLDTYIDDYSLADPIPDSMLRQMVSAQFLKLFDTPDSETTPQPAAPEQTTLTAPAENMAQLPQGPDAAAPTAPPPFTDPVQDKHADTDLRLQPHPAPAAPGTGTSPE